MGRLVRIQTYMTLSVGRFRLLPHRCTDRGLRKLQEKIFVERARHHKPVLAGSLCQAGRNHFYALARDSRFIPIMRP